MNVGEYPHVRLRRLRQTPWMRSLVRQHRLHPSDLIAPFFVQKGQGKRSKIATLPGVERLTIDLLLCEAEKARNLGIVCIALFPYHQEKERDPYATHAYDDDNVIVMAIVALRKAFPDLGIIGDVALDAYTNHGHDGVLAPDGTVDNDKTIEVLCKQSLALAGAGCPILAPSDMMDGRIGAIRKTLDKHGYVHVVLMSYGVKYASHLYAPFREATGAPDHHCDKRTYQMDPANGNEAFRQVATDIQEGADMLIVKPGLPYLDRLSYLVKTFKLPTFGYHVSGEYAMLQAAAKQGLLNMDAVLEETLIAFKRAGATGILTYGAMRMAENLKKARDVGNAPSRKQEGLDD